MIAFVSAQHHGPSSRVEAVLGGSLCPLVACAVLNACGPRLATPSDSTGEHSQNTSENDDGELSTASGIDCVPANPECPEGEKCQPYVKEEGSCCVDWAKCVNITGDKQIGERCTRELYGDDCAAQLFCMGPTSGTEGTGPEFECYPLCDATDPDSCENLGVPNGVCNQSSTGVLTWCDVPCDPLEPECQPGEGCYPFFNGFWCFPSDVAEGSSGEQGQPCNPGAEHSCSPGWYCEMWEPELVPGCEGPACCTSYCDIRGSGSECRDPAECIAWFEPGDDAWDPDVIDTVGHCLTPT